MKANEAILHAANILSALRAIARWPHAEWLGAAFLQDELFLRIGYASI